MEQGVRVAINVKYMYYLFQIRRWNKALEAYGYMDVLYIL